MHVNYTQMNLFFKWKQFFNTPLHVASLTGDWIKICLTFYGWYNIHIIYILIYIYKYIRQSFVMHIYYYYPEIYMSHDTTKCVFRSFRSGQTQTGLGERGGSVVECRTPEREVRGSRPTAAVLCPWARHFTPRKYWLITQEAMAPSRHDWKIVDWDVKPQHNQPTNKPAWAVTKAS